MGRGLPLIRVPAGANDTGDFGPGGGQWPDKHAGISFDLDPGKTYEIELTLSDPDGGGPTNTTNAATRPMPVAAPSAVTKPVTPSSFAGTHSKRLARPAALDPLG
ncbi:MAG: hypothetical protein JXP73_08480 [Deltaproteobacteria bacterium]|nr:hypothetical protein [Deltaproteobacteria bacterium]